MRSWLAVVALLVAVGCGSSSPKTIDASVADAPQGMIDAAIVDAGPEPDAMRAALGTACTTDSTCTSGHCVDGVCCESTCSGTCESCAMAMTGQPSGMCKPSLAGSDPDNECADEGATSCGKNGSCDGAGACALYDATTVCSMPTCSGGMAEMASTCNGTGTCLPPAAVTCAPFGCAGTVCATMCASDGDCDATTGWCDTTMGVCVTRGASAASCNADDQCLSNHCADNVCCDAACNGTCEACLGIFTGGADGSCLPATQGGDPHGDCSDAGSTSCGTDGVCNGSRACEEYPSSTVCVPSACVGMSAQLASMCDGSGTCVPGGTAMCAPYICTSGACLASCGGDLDCDANDRCAGGACKLREGQTCAAGGQCASGFCVDGVCCDGMCAGTCFACTAAKKGGGADGACGVISVGTDPDNECAATSASTCGTDGVCDGAGACQDWAVGTVCVNSFCSSATTLTNAHTCNGTGTCTTPGVTTQDCTPYKCATGACTTTCSADTDCATNNHCNATNICLANFANGTACSRNGECAFGNCVDGFCCNSTCAGLCQACSAAKKGTGANGTCGSIIAGSDPDNECAGAMVCNGAGGCI
jgi:hypothetical protein